MLQISHKLVAGGILPQNRDVQRQLLSLLSRHHEQVADELAVMGAEILAGRDDMIVIQIDDSAVRKCLDDVFEVFQRQGKQLSEDISALVSL